MKPRELKLSSGKIVICGRNAETNEDVVKQAGTGETIVHTKAPGSPFCNIKGEATKKDTEEAAILCARHSKDWKKNKSDVEIHVFRGKDIFKEEGMKTGTFGVKKAKSIIAKKEDIERFMH